MTIDKALISTLKEHAGIDADRLGPAAVSSALQQRMQALQLDSVQTYIQILRTNAHELDQFIDQIVVPETWFFRDLPPAEKLLALLCRQRLRRPGKPVSILCLPCATGEEPYSIAMLLLHHGITPLEFRIDAFDIHQQSIDKAMAGDYGAHSFRNTECEEYLTQYFTTAGSAYRIRPEIKQQVSFKRINLFADEMRLHWHQYDLLFCRNLLIYFSDDKRNKAYDILHHCLRDHGVLFMSSAESSTVPENLFSPLPQTSGCAFEKKPPAALRHVQTDGRDKLSRTRITTLRLGSRPQATAEPASVKVHARHERGASPPAAAALPVPSDCDKHWIIDKAWKLADQGLYTEALDLCRQSLRTEDYDAQVYYLLGLINNSLGHYRDSERYLRKTIYLDPKHHEALIHLSLLLENKGDHRGALRMLERAKKAQQRVNEQ